MSIKDPPGFSSKIHFHNEKQVASYLVPARRCSDSFLQYLKRNANAGCGRKERGREKGMERGEERNRKEKERESREKGRSDFGNIASYSYWWVEGLVWWGGLYNEVVVGRASPVHSSWKAPSSAWPVRVSLKR